jgi:Zn-dependent protease
MYPTTPYDINFRFFRFPIRIHPLFWVIFFLFGVNIHHQIENMAIWFLNIAIWIAAAFVAILVHELGHAFVFRHIFGVPSNIVIHGFGGATIPVYSPPRRNDVTGLFCNVFLSAAGPLAGFVLAGFIFVALNAWFGETFLLDGLAVGGLNLQSIMLDFLSSVVMISIVWGIFNLLPIYPMDGGHIAREIFLFIFPRNGVANSLVLSITVAIIFAVLTFQFGQLFITFLFGYFAYQNYQELSFTSFRRW